ncbi:MAG TPA: SOS response-associated peptidase [Bacteroidales bacterium]|nr:SOS response-associated peptidase [Bacteroidales bacterium]
MCFTVNVNLIKEELENRYGATFLDPDKYRPSYYYHAYAMPDLPVICEGNSKKISVMKWGLIPYWTKSRQEADEIRLKTLNARAESAESKPSFSPSFSSKRCLVPVSGFFEWQHHKSEKIPWYIFRSDEDIMSLGGLWAEWTDRSTGEILNTFSVITTTANRLMSEIHNSRKRMPVIIEKDNEQAWLSPQTSTDDLRCLLEPYPDSVLRAHTISNLINDRTADRNSPEIIRPFARPAENLLF